jgi:hypothetical protein
VGVPGTAGTATPSVAAMTTVAARSGRRLVTTPQ